MEIHLAITAHGHGLGLIVDFNDVLDSCVSLSSVDQTDVGSNQHKTRSTRYWEKNTRRLRKNTRGEKKIRVNKNKNTRANNTCTNGTAYKSVNKLLRM
jgi:hypothetical protein